MFANEFKSMLYVKDVAAEKEFWEKMGFVITKEQTILDFPSFDMKVSPESNCGFTVYALDFIQKYSPDIVQNHPNLLFFSPDVEALYQRAKTISPHVSPLNQLPYKNFSFESPSGHYYTVRQTD